MGRSGWGGGFVIPDRREFWERKDEDENDNREAAEMGGEGDGWGAFASASKVRGMRRPIFCVFLICAMVTNVCVA